MSEGAQVKKALILAAGFGTRFLPASKVIPKVMFPVLDKPIIQIIVEEVVKAGISDITFVVSPLLPEIRRHFEPFPELNVLLARSGKRNELDELKKIERMAKFSFCFQKPGRYGIGMAILSARELIGNQPFLMLFSDEFYYADPPWITQLVNAYEEFQGSILGCIRTTKPEDGNRFGFVTGEAVNEKITRVADLVEKPGVGKAPSSLASMSGMVFEPEIFDCFVEADKELPEDKELFQTYGVKKMLAKGKPFFAVEYQNYRYFDTGDRFGYLKSLVELGLEYPQFKEEFSNWLKNKISQSQG